MKIHNFVKTIIVCAYAFGTFTGCSRKDQSVNLSVSKKEDVQKDTENSCGKLTNIVRVFKDGEYLSRMDNVSVCSSKMLIVEVINQRNEDVAIVPPIGFNNYIVRTETINPGESVIAPSTIPDPLGNYDNDLIVEKGNSVKYEVDIGRGLYIWSNAGMTNEEFLPGWHSIEIEFSSIRIKQLINLKWVGEKLSWEKIRNSHK